MHAEIYENDNLEEYDWDEISGIFGADIMNFIPHLKIYVITYPYWD